MKGLAYGLPTFVLWAAVIGRLPAVRRDPANPRLRAYWLGLLALAVAVTVLRPPWGASLDDTTDVREPARLLGHGLVLACLCAVEAFLAYSVYPEHRARGQLRGRLWALGAAVGTMTAMFLLIQRQPPTGQANDRVTLAILVLGYWLAFHSYLATGLVNMIRLNWRWANQTDRVDLRLGLRLTTVGAMFGLAEVAYSVPFLTANQLGWPPPAAVGDHAFYSQLLLAATVVPVVVGTTMPAWGPRVGLPRLLVWAGRYRAYLRLYPLWRALCQAVPEVALEATTSAVADAWRGRQQLGFQLQRRCTEIRDAQLKLRPWANPQAAEAAMALGRQAGLDGEKLQAVVEGASLAAAVQAKTRRWPPATAPTPAASGQGGGDLDTESAWLGRIAVAYRRSPIVQAILAADQQAQWQTVQRSDG